MHILLIFLDGVGIGNADPKNNPFFAARYETLHAILGGAMPSRKNGFIETKHAICIPLNATLGVEGLPQSGTGQATLYTGINCAKLIGKHFGPHLYSTLKPIVATQNIFSKIQGLDSGFSCALANAFPKKFFDYISGEKPRAIAGVFAAMSAGIELRSIRHLQEGSAISTDITAARWRQIGHPEATSISAYEAGKRLARLSRQHHFTLFEIFFTDKAGHERSMENAVAMLHDIDELLAGTIDHCGDTHIIVTSDHGNIEDLSTKSHTRNRVPGIIIGEKKRIVAQQLCSVEDLTPVILNTLQSP